LTDLVLCIVMNTKSTISQSLGYSRKHVNTLEKSALAKLRPIFELARELGVDELEVSQAIIEESERRYQDQLLITLAEDLGLAAPTHRLESFEDSVRSIFLMAEKVKTAPGQLEFNLQ
jgi:hypothetical protein